MDQQLLCTAHQASGRLSPAGEKRQKQALLDAKYGPIGSHRRYRRGRVSNAQYTSAIYGTNDQKEVVHRFNSMHRNAVLNMGMQNSPFLPQDPVQYLAVFADKQTTEDARLNCIMTRYEESDRSQRQARMLAMRRRELAANENLLNDDALFAQFLELPVPQPPVFPLFHGNPMDDGLSAVLAADTCFNAISQGVNERKDDGWPSLADYNIWKATQQGSGLPPPARHNRPQDQQSDGWLAWHTSWVYPQDTDHFNRPHTPRAFPSGFGRNQGCVKGSECDKVSSDETSRPAEITLFQLRLFNRGLEALIREMDTFAAQN